MLLLFFYTLVGSSMFISLNNAGKSANNGRAIKRYVVIFRLASMVIRLFVNFSNASPVKPQPPGQLVCVCCCGLRFIFGVSSDCCGVHLSQSSLVFLLCNILSIPHKKISNSPSRCCPNLSHLVTSFCPSLSNSCPSLSHLEAVCDPSLAS